MLPAVTDTTDTDAPDDVGRSAAVEAAEQNQDLQQDSMDMAMDSPDPLASYADDEGLYSPDYVTVQEDIWGPISVQAEQAYSQVSGGWSMPGNGNVTQAFGVRNSLYSAGYHTGVDISASAGDPVKAPVGGTVVAAGWAGKYGNTVQIRHPDGKVSLLAHNQNVTVRVGQQVNAGQVVARAGSTGQSFGVHIHWEVRNPSNRYGDVVNPMTWITQQRSAPGVSRSGSRPSAGSIVSQAQAYQLARQVGFNEYEARMMAAIMPKESSGRSGVVNSIGATGLWQVLWPVHRSMLAGMGITSQEQLKDPYTNARAAYRIYKDRGGGANGFRAWAVWYPGMQPWRG